MLASARAWGPMTSADNGMNEGLLEELYDQYRRDPDSVPERWREYFGASPVSNGARRAPAPAGFDGDPTASDRPQDAAAHPGGRSPGASRRVGARPGPRRPTLDPRADAGRGPGDRTRRGRRRAAAGRRGSHGDEHGGVARRPDRERRCGRCRRKLLEVNRQILNNHSRADRRGKVSFTHLIAFAVVQALGDFPGINASYALRDAKPTVTRHHHVNLGLAVDVTREDGTRTLLVPNIKRAEELDFAGFWTAYEDLVAKVRATKLSPDDFAATTGTITNPGMIGTVHSVPRLMPGQGFIVGVGTIGYPAEYQGADPQLIAQLGVSPVTTLTNTYDHRIIGGAESGEFLRRIHQLLLGEDGFYDEVFRSLEVPYEPARWNPTRARWATPPRPMRRWWRSTS